MATHACSTTTPARPLLRLRDALGRFVKRIAAPVADEIERQGILKSEDTPELAPKPLLPAPAPVPSLIAAFSRRRAIFGAVVAPMALAGCTARSETRCRSSGPYEGRLTLLDAEAGRDSQAACLLIGSPTAPAVPVTDALLRRYVTFIAREHALALRELAERETPHRFEPGQPAWHPPMFWVPEIDVATQAMMEGSAPSTRAAVVLSAANVPLRGSLA